MRKDADKGMFAKIAPTFVVRGTLRLAIYLDEASGTTRLTYDQPSRLMSGIGNASLMEAAEALDAKLAAFAEQVTGAKAN
jgi:hypothetical protein